MRLGRPLAALLCCGVALGGSACERRESPEESQRRVRGRLLHDQIHSLEALVSKAESGGLDSENQIAIAVTEEVVKGILEASLPLEVSLGERAHLTIESALPYFRGNQGMLMLQTKIRSVDVPDAHASVELGGVLKDFRLQDGQLSAHVSLAHFRVLEASVGKLAAVLIEDMVKQSLDKIEASIPPLVVPVNLQQSVKISGLDEGPVMAKGGALPLEISVAQVIPINERLWVLLDAKAGPWQALPPPPRAEP